LHEFNLDEEERVGKMCRLRIHKSLFVTSYYNYVRFGKLKFKGCANLCIVCVWIRKDVNDHTPIPFQKGP
jgi:hypothetical protein